MARSTEASVPTTNRTATRSSTKTSTASKNTKKSNVSKSGNTRMSSLSPQKSAKANKNVSRKKTTKVDIISTEQRLQMIRELAYRFAEQRGFTAGNEQTDWLQAEREIDTTLIK